MELMVVKYSYGNDKHRAIRSDEIVRLLNETKGLTVKTITDILAVNANNKTKALVNSNLISSQYLTGITAGRAPRVFFKSSVKVDIDKVLDSMTLGYVMWYLRQNNLLTTSVNIDDDYTLSTYLALENDTSRHLLIKARLILFDKNIDDKVKTAIKYNYCPTIIVNANEKEYCYDKLMNTLSDEKALVVTIKQRQNAKYLNSSLVSSSGVFDLKDGDTKQFNDALSKLKTIEDDELYDDVLAEYKKAEVLRRQHVPALMSKIGANNED